MNQPRSLQALVDDFLTQPAPEGPGLLADAGGPPGFSPFDNGDAARATALFEEFSALAGRAADRREALAAVIDRAQTLRPENPALVSFAFNLFVTHHPSARGVEVTPLELRAPTAVLPSPPPSGPALLAAAPGRERELAWFREDAKANEHHEHWHYVFWRTGETGRTLKDRHGEMFFYMHQQMLARYDAERRALGIGPAADLANYGDAIPEEYDPGPGLAALPPRSDLGGPFFPRVAGRTIAAGTQNVMSAFRTRVEDAIASGVLEGGAAVDSDTLGLAVEDAGGVRHDGTTSSVPLAFYGNLHGQGHGATAALSTGGFGVMSHPATAIRDPVFWRWHRHVDTFNFAWQETQDAHDFAVDAPAHVRVRDVVLAFKDQVEGLTDRASGERFGRERFGGGRWKDDFAGDGPQSTGVLETMMCRRALTDREGHPLEDELGDPFVLEYLDQRPFVYFFRLENEADTAREVTVRVWIVPAEAAEDRRAWIEMDKFRYTLQPGERAVVYRPAQESSVIRKPAQKPPVSYLDFPEQEEGEEADEENYCTCGWPYNLLLPRGTEEGAAYRLLVVLTDYEGDRVAPLRPSGRTCGSVSFCGLRDDRFPDGKAMGYPFHRRFERSIAETVAAFPSMAVRDFTIRHVAPQGDPPQYHEPAPPPQ